MVSFKIHQFFRQSVFLLLLMTVVIAAYIDAMDAPFVLDDPRVVERSLKIRDISNFLDAREIFSARPLVNLSFALNYQIAGLDVGIYHATNLLFHLLNTFLVFFLTRQIFSLSLKTEKTDKTFASVARLAPFFAASLFALHPIQSQAVIYISQRAALMACFFYLLSTIFYIQARMLQKENLQNIKSFLFFVLCILFAMMAFLSKKNAASLPLMILMIELMIFTDFRSREIKKIAILLIIISFLVLCFAWLAGTFGGNLTGVLQRIDRLTRETTEVSRWQYLMTQFTVILLYMRLIAFPNGLNIDHGYPMKNEFFHGFTPYACLILLILLILSVIYARKFKIISFGIFWFFIALSVESSILPIRDAMFEHRVYLALPGICMIFAFLMLKFAQSQKVLALFISIGVFLIFAISIFIRTQIWQSEFLLWQDAAKKAPHNARAWNNYGDALFLNGNQQAAFAAFKNAIAASPSYAWPYCNLGKIYVQRGSFKKAEALFLQSIERLPRFAEAHNNLAVVYMKQNQIEKGIRYFEKAVQIDNEQPDTHYNLGKAYLDLNQPDKAMDHLMLAVTIKPDIYPNVDYLIGAIWAMKSKPKNAARWIYRAQQKGFDKAMEFIEKDPRFASCRSDVLLNLSKFY